MLPPISPIITIPGKRRIGWFVACVSDTSDLESSSIRRRFGALRTYEHVHELDLGFLHLEAFGMIPSVTSIATDHDPFAFVSSLTDTMKLFIFVFGICG